MTSYSQTHSSARERIFINLARDELGDELTNSSLDKREVELDKSLIKLIQSACKSDKAPRVLELTKRLHFTHSIGAASQLAGFYRLLGLQEKIDAIKQWREEEGVTPEVRARQRRQELDDEDRYMTKPKKPFQDFEPPKRFERPGLARPAAVVEHTEFTASNAASRAIRARIGAQDAQRSASPPEGKRKRDEQDEVEAVELEEELPKRRAVAEEDAAAPSPKSKSVIFISVMCTNQTDGRTQEKTLSLARRRTTSIRNAIHSQENPNMTNLFRRVKVSSIRSSPLSSLIKANVSTTSSL